MQKVLVIGSEGFIGKHVMYGFAGKFDVFRADTKFCDDANYFRTDVTRHEEIQAVLDRFEPDVVLNLAGEYGIENGEEHPARCFDINTTAVLRLCMECTKRGIRLVHLSTGDVYGELFDGLVMNEGIPIPVTAPRNLYSLSKLAGEGVVQNYRENYGLDACIVRPFMVYGPGEPPSHYRSAMVRMCDAAAHGDRPLIVHRGAERAWMYVRDFVEALALVIEKGVGDYNIGSDDYLSLQRLAEMIVKEAERGEVIVTDPPAHHRSMMKRVDFARIKALGWEPKVSVEEGVVRVIDWCRMLMGNARHSEDLFAYRDFARAYMGY